MSNFAELKCRACLTSGTSVHNIFDVLEVEGISLADMLEKNTVIKVNKNDGLPPYFCESCSAVVKGIDTFVRSFQKSHNYLTILKLEDESAENPEIKLEHDGYVYEEEVVADEIRDANDMSYGHIFEDEHMESILDDMDSGASNNLDGITIGTVKYSCTDCGDCFLMQSDFQHHMLELHQMKIEDYESYSSDITLNIPNEYFKCVDCEEKFDNHLDLDKHSKIHRRFICEHCGTSFTKKKNLNDHREVHLTERSRVCPICSKTFKSRSSFGRHKQIHANKQAIICEQCGAAFNSNGNLKVHIILKHTDERPFLCKLCDKTFPIKSWLNKHMLRKHNNAREKISYATIAEWRTMKKLHLIDIFT